MKEKLLVILGPTATGKTDLALQLACKFQGELISVDSRQVYKDLNIGTGKAPSIGNWKMENRRWIVNGINIWMYDVISPKRQYSVADYVKDAEKVVRKILKRNKLPIIVGGSGLYIKALLEGLPNLSFPVDKNLRKNLEKLSLEQLQKKLQEISFKAWKKMNYSDQQNPRRLVRQIELSFTSEESLRATIRGGLFYKFNILKIGLTASREILYKRVDERVLLRIDQGMIEEAVNLHKNGLSLSRMRQLGLEYGVLADYLDGKISGVKELTKIMQGKIHGYLRRQQTWFKKPCLPAGRTQNVFWFDITDLNYIEKVENKVRKWYY